jgi:hypothetical protein
MTTQTSDTTAATTWRARLYWAWHAWRLRHAQGQEGSGAVSVFNNFSALSHRGYADALFDLHAALAVVTPGLQPDDSHAFRRRLMRELSTRSCMTLFANGDGSVGGYAWGRVATYDEALDHFQRLPSLAHLSGDDWMRLLACVPDAAPLLIINDIGLDIRYRRGFAPLKQLLKPLIDLAERHGAKRALWWVPRGSAMHAMSLSFGARPVYENATTVFVVLNDLRAIARIFSALAAGEISDLLSRIAPARPAAAARPTVVNLKLAPRPAPPADGEMAA